MPEIVENRGPKIIPFDGVENSEMDRSQKLKLDQFASVNQSMNQDKENLKDAELEEIQEHHREH